MKPPLFEYIRAETIEQAVGARATHEYSAVLAGGQSLLPTLNFRLARPEAVIDIGRIAALQGTAVQGQEIIVRAMARQRAVERDDAIFAANPLIRETLGHVAHAIVRNRGTIVGSISHADAAAELPALLLATGGAVIARGPKGERRIEADAFFQFHMTTTLKPDEIAIEVRIPTLPARTGWAFMEFTRRHGDYALAGVCALLTLGADGRISAARLAGCGIASRPVRLGAAEGALIGQAPGVTSFAAAGRAAREAVTAADDRQASKAFRRHLLDQLVVRALNLAAERATGAPS
ncbi:MAG: xanthine dehydrogenase family protein subunit M [Alphaproteobacteria bacterium]|nr:xanthine dehydrogenase family protein subunit M [Alphaproteobacteria bacterium]